MSSWPFVSTASPIHLMIQYREKQKRVSRMHWRSQIATEFAYRVPV
jgi:hypothetical protein